MTLRPLASTAAVRVVAEREVRERVRTKAFRWGTLAMVVLAAGLALLPRVLPDDGDPAWRVAVVGAEPDGLAERVAVRAAAESATVELRREDGGPTELAGQGAVDAVLVDGRELVADGEVPPRLQGLLTAVLAELELAAALGEAGLADAEVAELLDVEPLAVRTLEGADDDAREAVAFLGIVVLLVAILTYGSWVLHSVLEEKANRIVELVVSAITPSQLLAGKVLGVGLVGIGQLVLVLVVAVAAGAAAGTLPDLPAFVPVSVAWALVWFVLGFGLYAVGYAAAASLTARQEDAQNAGSPLLAVVLVAYFVSLAVVIPDPGSGAARVLSLVPPLAPMVVPARIASDAIEPWEVAAAVALTLIAIWVTTRLAARVYRNALLHTGARLRFRAAFRGEAG